MAKQKLTLEQRRERAATKLAVAKARLAKLESTAKEQERRSDTRRKVLLGSYVLHLLAQSDARAAALREWCKADLARFIREQDRVLFQDLL